MSILVAAKQLSRYYGTHCAVDKVSFELKQGEVLGFLGINGAGKTTTMQMLSGNLAPSSGQIIINGFDLLTQPLAAKKSIGYLPDQPPLYKDLTVTEFLQYCARLHRLPNAEINKAVQLAQQRCGLTDVSQRLIGLLSKGYQQRVGIAQAIVHNPSVIILDEPTVGLDPIQIKEIRSLIKELGNDHAVILSTHILPEVQESCSHVQIIHQGQIILYETVAGLNLQANTATLKLVTRAAINKARLMAITGVIQVETVSTTEYLIRHSQEANPIEAITETVISAGWGLIEITPLKRSMEDIFIALTQANDGSK